ncbi:MAG: HAMP domain-containing histidine kinase [Parasporobacterium sp.]|nr:HAMP domain-containing histidine kinase [Parasporobacterium sp.]
MIKTIFRNILLVGVSVLIICGLLFFALQYTGSRNDGYEALRQEAVYAQAGLLLDGTEYLEQLDPDNPVVWIGADGRILFSNGTGQEKATEDPEVRDAFNEGEGHAIRRSDQDSARILYYAFSCPDGSVLRLSMHLRSIWDAFLRVSPVLWVLVIVLIISAVLAFRAARKIVKPINEIDLDHPDEESYPEIRPLIEKIQEQKLTIQDETFQREQMRREFTANISHELKAPVTAISGFAQLMSEGIVSPEKTKEYSGEIHKESQRLISLIDDIIALSNLDQDAVGPTQEDIDLRKLSYEVLDSLRSKAEQSHVSLEVKGEEVHVRGISQLLSEMLHNLCDNAIKYNHAGGSVTVELSENETQVRLCVADTGIGIPEEYQSRVFERFFRVDKTHSSGIEGTGLGLSIVKHGARFHNASVELESTEGEGTRITLVFPKEQKD